MFKSIYLYIKEQRRKRLRKKIAFIFLRLDGSCPSKFIEGVINYLDTGESPYGKI